jgi:hypothetical protein
MVFHSFKLYFIAAHNRKFIENKIGNGYQELGLDIYKRCNIWVIGEYRGESETFPDSIIRWDILVIMAILEAL